MQYIIICLISLSFYSLALADTLQGITIVDDSGKKHRIRLAGIDAPEKDQPYGIESTKNLERLINGKRTTINFSKHDRYGRIVGKVLVDPPSSVNKAPSDNKYLKQGRGYFSVSGFAVSMEDTKLESDNPSIIAEAAAESANTIIAKTTDGFGGALALGIDFTGPWRIEGEFFVTAAPTVTEYPVGSISVTPTEKELEQPSLAIDSNDTIQAYRSKDNNVQGKMGQDGVASGNLDHFPVVPRTQGIHEDPDGELGGESRNIADGVPPTTNDHRGGGIRIQGNKLTPEIPVLGITDQDGVQMVPRSEAKQGLVSPDDGIDPGTKTPTF